MSENILSTDPAPSPSELPSGSDLEVVPIPPAPAKSPILLFISLALLSIVSVFAIYLFLQVRALTLEATATPAPTPTPVASEDPTADWATYTNELFAFQFNYPPGFSLTDNLQESLDPLAWTTKKTLTLSNSTNNCTLMLMINPDGFGPWFPNKTLTVGSNSRDGLSVIGETENTENLTAEIYQIVVSGSITDRKVNGLWMSANCSNTPPDKDYLDATINNILSTFKFTD